MVGRLFYTQIEAGSIPVLGTSYVYAGECKVDLAPRFSPETLMDASSIVSTTLSSPEDRSEAF